MALKRHYPTAKEISAKVSEALKAIDNESIEPITDIHDHLALELCDIESIDDVYDYVQEFLREIQAQDPYECFKHARKGGWVEPSDKHKGYHETYLYPFVFFSETVDCDVYLKFAIKKPSKKNPHYTLTYCHLDCHENQPQD